MWAKVLSITILSILYTLHSTYMNLYCTHYIIYGTLLIYIGIPIPIVSIYYIHNPIPTPTLIPILVIT